LGQNLGVFPLEQTRLVGVAKSEHLRLTSLTVKLISKNSYLCDHNPPNVTDRRTDGQTDRQTDRQTE